MINKRESPKIVVVGSSSIDLVLTANHIPLSNETVIADRFENFFGGKGANQAVATARLGASVHFVSCVGMDPLGQQVMRNLIDEGINVGFVAETEDASTGTAYVTTAKGENAIVVVPAANFELRKRHIEDADKVISAADLLLIQLEIPIEVVEFTVRLAKKYGTEVGIYASPAHALSQDILDYAKFIIVKSSELETVFGTELRDEVLKKYPNKLFVRDDMNATIYYNGSEMKYFREECENNSHKIGMGDAFTSGLAIALCHKNSIEDSVKFGNQVSLKVALQRGSQSSLPFLRDFYPSKKSYS